MDTVARSLSYFEQVFGPYPLDELAVVALPRRYSQSYLGFITLTDTILYGPTQDHGFDADAFRDTLVAHEVAHQWWGNMVGWWSYRDQWLSEATANYAGLLFYDHQQGEGSTYLAEKSAGWRESLSQRTADGRTIESLGPVVLGGRLNSSLSNSAYQEIVYRKGAVVLAMLARAVGEEAFLQMLHEVIDATRNKVLTTDSFIQAIERMSGLDLAGFAQQYIYGTGVPRVYYRYAKEPDVEEGGWTVRGEVHLLGDPGFELAVTRNMSGGWDIERTPKRRPETESTAMMVPSRVVFASAEGSTNRGSVNRRDSQWHNLFIRGQDDRFEIRTDKEPETLHLDPHGEILARFYAEERHPKRCLRYAAQDLLLEGKLEQAETMYHQALTAESGEPTLQDGRSGDLSRDGSREDARIHLDLARLYLDQARLEPAGEQLQRAEDLLASDSARFRMEREVLASRLDVRNRDYDSAYRRLRKTLRLMSTGDAVRSWRSMRVRLRLSSEREAVREAFALFAIAALETDNPEDLAWANREARDRGVDVLLLDLASADSRRP
jgi:aminopeptidase N